MRYSVVTSLFILLACSKLQGQRQQPSLVDSIVIIETEEFEEDTVSAYSKQVMRFRKGNLLEDIKCNYIGKKTWIDSTITQTAYANGKKVREFGRTVMEDVPAYESENDYNEGAESAKSTDAQLRVYRFEKLFLDSMTVSKGYYQNGNEIDLYIDSIVYCFNKRWLKYSAEYHNDLQMHCKRKEYIFDTEKKLEGFVTIITNLTGTYTCKESVVLAQKDTLILERNWLNQRHVGTFTQTERWTYNSSNLPLSYEVESEGKVQKNIEYTYYPTDDIKSIKTRYEDGLISENLFWWKNSPKRKEMWAHFESRFTFETKGEIYSAVDTLFVDGKIQIRKFEFEIEGKAADCKPQSLDKRNSYQIDSYDEKKRILNSLTRNTENGARKSSRQITYNK